MHQDQQCSSGGQNHQQGVSGSQGKHRNQQKGGQALQQSRRAKMRMEMQGKLKGKAIKVLYENENGNARKAKRQSNQSLRCASLDFESKHRNQQKGGQALQQSRRAK